MLNQIHIRDLATIEDQQLFLNQGCTMITGETGAGKSIFIEAIELALGARASANLVRPGKERTDISLCFDISKLPAVKEWLTNNDFPQDTDECIIRRVIGSDGRSRSYVNSIPTTLQPLHELGGLLFHLHGQYEQQVLLKADNQRDILDRYAEQLPLAHEVKALSSKWHALNQQIISLQENNKERTERADYLRFQLDELNALQLKPGEWETLEAEHRKLSHSDELIHHLQRVLQLLTEDEARNAQAALHETRKLLEQAQQVETKAGAWLNTASALLIQLDDLNEEIRTYLEEVNLDPDHLRQIEQRVGQLFDLSRKHKVQPEALYELVEKLTRELQSLDTSDERIATLQAELASIAKKYDEKAIKLSQNRVKASARFAKEITASIRSLSLPHGEFTIRLEKESTPYSTHGLERIAFLIKTNPDQTQQPLAKVVSGGELSRLSLAVHLSLAHQSAAATLIFDEVDTGMSGGTAEKIGKLLRKLGETNQVFCVSHQAQVAACGHHHLLVEKSVENKTTHTRLRFLTTEERTNEIARMLGGETITEKTLAHAKEVLMGA